MHILSANKWFKKYLLNNVYIYNRVWFGMGMTKKKTLNNVGIDILNKIVFENMFPDILLILLAADIFYSTNKTKIKSMKKI